MFPTKPTNSGEDRRQLGLARIRKLPKGLQSFICDGGIYPELSTREFRRQATIAKELTTTTGGEIEVQFSSCFYENDYDAAGHLFYVNLPIETEQDKFDLGCLDDRKPDLRGQLAAELRRVAGEYLRLAGMVRPLTPDGAERFAVLQRDDAQWKVRSRMQFHDDAVAEVADCKDICECRIVPDIYITVSDEDILASVQGGDA